jgi:2-keto-3-deoxy-6-phosphogluconate aldolase
MDLAEVLKKVKVVPVAAVSSVEKALKISELLSKHSINLIEVTLRT